MPCANPPELTNKQLLQFLDEEASEGIRNHIEQCSHCRERAVRLARLNNMLRHVLNRVTCPPAQELGEYQLGLLTPEHADRIKEHLSVCPDCSHELEQTESFLTATASDLNNQAVGPQSIRKATLLTSRSISLGFALVGLRGQGEDPIIYQAEDVMIALNVDKQTSGSSYRSMIGLITGADIDNMLAILWQGDNLLDSVPVDDAGNFTFKDISAGTYELILSRPSGESGDIKIDKLTL